MKYFTVVTILALLVAVTGVQGFFRGNKCVLMSRESRNRCRESIDTALSELVSMWNVVHWISCLWISIFQQSWAIPEADRICRVCAGSPNGPGLVVGGDLLHTIHIIS